MQFFILEMLIAPLISFDKVNRIYFYLMIAPAISITVIAICVLIENIINNQKYLRLFLLGKSNINKPTALCKQN